MKPLYPPTLLVLRIVELMQHLLLLAQQEFQRLALVQLLAQLVPLELLLGLLLLLQQVVQELLPQEPVPLLLQALLLLGFQLLEPPPEQQMQLRYLLLMLQLQGHQKLLQLGCLQQQLVLSNRQLQPFGYPL